MNPPIREAMPVLELPSTAYLRHRIPCHHPCMLTTHAPFCQIAILTSESTIHQSHPPTAHLRISARPAHCLLPTTNTNARPTGSAAATAAQRLSVDNDQSHGSNYVLLLLLLCSVVPGDERWWVLRVVIPGRNNTGIDTTPPSANSTGTPRAGLNGPHHHLHASVDVDFDPMAVCAPMANTSLLAWFYLLPSKLTDRWTSPLDRLLGTRCTRGSPDQTGVPLEQDSLPYSSRSNTTYMFPYRLLLARFIHRIPHFLR